MAIADQWDIWYLNAGMSFSAASGSKKRFMRDFDTGFAVRHHAALARMAERVGLDYFLVDCAENKHGELLIFEADNTAVVHNMDSPELFPYKPPQMRRSSKPSPPCCIAAPGRAASAPRDEGAEALPLRAEPHARSARLGRRFAPRPIACSTTCWTTSPISASARSGSRSRRGSRAFSRRAAARARLGDVYREFTDFIAPYAAGNVHPGFMGWVHGGGTPSACWPRCWRPD